MEIDVEAPGKDSEQRDDDNSDLTLSSMGKPELAADRDETKHALDIVEMEVETRLEQDVQASEPAVKVEEPPRFSRRVTRSSTQPSQRDVAELRLNKKMKCLENMEEIDREFQAIQKLFFITKVRELEKEYADILSGEHTGYNENIEKLAGEEESQILELQVWFRLQLKNLENEYNAEVKRISEQFRSEREALKQEYLDEIAKKKSVLENNDGDYELTDDGLHVEVSRLKRNLRRKPNSGESTYTKRKLLTADLLFTLTDEEIQEDILAAGLTDINKTSRIKTRSKA